MYMKFTPDGTKIAFTTYTDQKVEFWILPWPDGPDVKPRKIFKDRVFSDTPAFEWLPDSRRMVLSFDNGMWIADTDDESLQRITSSQMGEDFSSVSNDGKRILFETSNMNYDVVLLPFD